VTHPDADHIGGLPEIFSRFSVGLFVESGASADTALAEALAVSVRQEKAQRLSARRDMTLSLGAGVFARVLFPDRDMAAAESNSTSVIVQVTYGETEFLLMGDAPKSIERYLLTLEGLSLSSDVLKIGHHGSQTSSAPEFLAAVSPAIAVISVGAENRYGHPDEEVLDALAQAQVRVVRTDEAGRIVFYSDGEKVIQE
jgi:competence protein ComEC